MLRLLLGIALFSLPITSKQIPSVDLEGLKRILEPTSDSVYVVNFWATWCRPCVEEMPAFVELSKDTQIGKVKIMLLSLDSRKKLPDSSMVAFMNRKEIPQHLVSYLEAGDPNLWMGLVSKEWDGAIPATLIFKKGEKPVFLNESLSIQALRNNIKQFNR